MSDVSLESNGALCAKGSALPPSNSRPLRPGAETTRGNPGPPPASAAKPAAA